ncbi:MAG: trigger factor [Candidatus Gastranaerophilales bacterium]
MKVTLEKEKENLVKLNITIPAKEASSAYDSASKRIAQYVNIDGFRKGKAPRQVIERHVGIDRIKQEAIELLMPKAINNAVVENKLDIIAQPHITAYEFELGKDLEVTAMAELKPEVTLGEYKNLSLKVEDKTSTDDMEEKSLQNLIKQHTTLETVTGRKTLATDTVMIDFDGSANGEKIQGGEAKNYALDLGNSSFIPGFADQIVGHDLEEEFDIKVTFPTEYHDEKLKGQPATFKIKINEIKEKKSPELNDEFAQKVGPFKNLDELKADVKKYANSQKENTNKMNSEAEVFKTVIENAKVEIPETMIQREVTSLKKEYQNRFAAQGISWEKIIENQGEAELIKTLTEDATNRIKNSLVIDKIAREESLKLEQKDLEKKFNQLAATYRMPVKELIQQLSKTPDALASISQQAMNDKVRDFLMENNKVEIVVAVEK